MKYSSVILITIDCLRSDYFLYALRKGMIPNFVKMMDKGLFFPYAYSTSSWTPASIYSIFSSKYPFSNGGQLHLKKTNSFVPLLKQNDFATSAFHSNPWLTKIQGFDYGFEKFYDSFDFDNSVTNKKRKQFINTLFDYLKKYGWGLKTPYLDASNINGLFYDWYKEINKKSFFSWIHYMDLHEPYYPENLYVSQIINRKYWLINKKWHQKVDYGSSKMMLLRHLYLNKLIKIDNHIGKLLSKIKNDENDVCIIITADHGQSFGEHNDYLGHGNELYEELIRVPLLLYPTESSDYVNNHVSLIQIAPTILELLGVTFPTWCKEKSIFENVENNTLIFSESSSEYTKLGNKTDIIPTLSVDKKIIACINYPWKYIYRYDYRDELYNIKIDESEKENVLNNVKITTTMLSNIVEHIKRNHKKL